MRNFLDSWQNLFDSNGNFLLGKIAFYEPNTYNLKTIYGSDGQALQNPIDTTTYGLTTSQVFLSNDDYTVRFYKYIGSGTMKSTSALTGENESWNIADDSNYELYKTITSLNGSLSIINANASIPTVNTIAELKDLTVSVLENGTIYSVFGYYQLGDCPQRYYIWHSSGTATDDGGITILSNNSNVGYWQMVIPADKIDVRWYGAMPNGSSSSNVCYLAQLALCATGCNTWSKDMYFPSYGNHITGYYLFDGSNTVSTSKDIYCDDVKFVVKVGTTGTSVQCNQLHKNNGTSTLFIPQLGQTIGGYSLTSNTIYTSWLNASDTTFSGIVRSELIVNTDQLTTVDGIDHISILTSLSAKKTWSNINSVTCNRKLVYNSDDSFTNVPVQDNWYTDITTFVASQWTDCTYTKMSFESTLNWVNLAVKDGLTVFDFMGDSLTTAVTFTSNCTIINASDLENALFPDSVTIQQSKVINSVITTGTLTATNSTIGIAAVDGECNLTNCEIVQDITLNSDSKLERCNISNQVTCSGILTLSECYITAYVFAKANSTKNIYLYARKNTFTTGTGTSVGKIVLLYNDSTDSGNVNFIGDITDNTVIKSGDGTNFILNANASFLSTNGHVYTYTGNKGTDVLTNSPKFVIPNSDSRIENVNVGSVIVTALYNFKPFSYLFYIGTGTTFPSTIHAKITPMLLICDSFIDATNNCPKEMQAGCTDSMYEPGDYPSKNSRTKEFLLSSVTANSVVGEYNPNATPADKFLVLCKGDTAPTEVSVLVELDLI